jgi:hypothetical protein
MEVQPLFLLEHTMKSSNFRDMQEPQSGKVANDRNKTGEQPPTQKNEGERTPQSRNDRESQVGSGNQSQSRRGATGR